MNSVDEINRMLEAIKTEEKRAYDYIHSKENRAKYGAVLNEHLIINRMPSRISKQDGWGSFIFKYEEGKEEWEQ